MPAPGAAIANALAIQSRKHDSRRHFTQGLTPAWQVVKHGESLRILTIKVKTQGFAKMVFARNKTKKPPEGG